MGCGASKQAADTAEQPQQMVEIKSSQSKLPPAAGADKKAAIAFEIPVDDLKVVSGQPGNALVKAASKKSMENMGDDGEALKQKIKDKEEQAALNRQKELDNIAAKSKKRDEQLKAAAERKKKLQESGEAGGSEPALDPQQQ